MSNIDLMYQAQKAMCHHLATANQYFDQSFPLPDLNFKLRGKAAGKAYLQSWEIRLNPILFSENTAQFTQEVIPHELAHLIAFRLFGRVKPHGKEWQMVMEQVFSVEAKATHNFQIISVQGQTFEYQCECRSYPLTIRRHNKVLRGIAQYNCRECKRQLVYTGVQLS